MSRPSCAMKLLNKNTLQNVDGIRTNLHCRDIIPRTSSVRPCKKKLKKIFGGI